MRKQCGLHFIKSSNNTSNLIIKDNVLRYEKQKIIPAKNEIGFDIYIISNNNDINDGDFVFNSVTNIQKISEIVKNNVKFENGLTDSIDNCTKIIATTSILVIERYHKDFSSFVFGSKILDKIVPQIPESFIKQFVNKWNRNIITSSQPIFVEYDTETIVKINNGFIAIYDSKDNYTKEEVLEFIKKSYETGYTDKDFKEPYQSGLAKIINELNYY